MARQKFFGVTIAAILLSNCSGEGMEFAGRNQDAAKAADAKAPTMAQAEAITTPEAASPSAEAAAAASTVTPTAKAAAASPADEPISIGGAFLTMACKAIAQTSGKAEISIACSLSEVQNGVSKDFPIPADKDFDVQVTVDSGEQIEVAYAINPKATHQFDLSINPSEGKSFKVLTTLTYRDNLIKLKAEVSASPSISDLSVAQRAADGSYSLSIDYNTHLGDNRGGARDDCAEVKKPDAKATQDSFEIKFYEKTELSLDLLGICGVTQNQSFSKEKTSRLVITGKFSDGSQEKIIPLAEQQDSTKANMVDVIKKLSVEPGTFSVSIVVGTLGDERDDLYIKTINLRAPKAFEMPKFKNQSR